MTAVPRQEIRTRRLTLRPTSVEDAARFHAIQSNWNVTRMLRMASFPSTIDAQAEWLATHRTEWLTGTAYRFAVIFDGLIVGCADVDEISEDSGELGYWFDEGYWRCGLATEAAKAVCDFAFNDIGLSTLVSAHAADNPASGRILERLGFQSVGEAICWSRSRQAEIAMLRYEHRVRDIS
jgi:[ribosomal protein S5]-alanine N-acetyltransferase